VLVGYFNTEEEGFVSKPNLETDVHADERGGLEPVIRDAATFSMKGMKPSDPAMVYPGINVHACKFEVGTHEMNFGKGRFLILGIVDEKQDLRPGNPMLIKNGSNSSVDWLFEGEGLEPVK